MNARPFQTTQRLCLRAAAFLASALLLLGATGGPDYSRYLDWAWAFARGDLFRLSGEWASPMGAPLTPWSHGPGLFYALPALVHRLLHDAFPLAARLFGDSLLAGWAAALLLWGALYRLFRQHADTQTALFWTGVAFLGTHAGYYSRSHGSESLSMGLLAVFALWIVPAGPRRLRDFLAAAMLGALLLAVRCQLILYVLPGMLLAWHRFAQGNAPPRIRAAGALAGLILLAAGFAQTFWVQRWMTGCWMQSPQQFGNGMFRSLDFMRPEFAAVLFHPWHGLLVYHPFYAFGALAMFRRIRLAPSRSERLFWAGLVAAMIAHLYLHASWYCWWLGTGTFGMRGLSAWSVIMPLAVREDHRSPDATRRIRLLYLYGALACSLWSFLLMSQGDTNHVDWTALWSAQVNMLRSPAVLAALSAAGIIGTAAWRARGSGNACAWSFAFLGLFWLLSEAASREACSRLVVPAGFAVLSGLCLLGALSSGKENSIAQPHPLPRWAGFAVLSIVFAGVNLLFILLMASAEMRMRAGELPQRAWAGVSQVYYPEVLECCQEYRLVAGFDEKKQSLESYLRGTGQNP